MNNLFGPSNLHGICTQPTSEPARQPTARATKGKRKEGGGTRGNAAPPPTPKRQEAATQKQGEGGRATEHCHSTRCAAPTAKQREAALPCTERAQRQRRPRLCNCQSTTRAAQPPPARKAQLPSTKVRSASQPGRSAPCQHNDAQCPLPAEGAATAMHKSAQCQATQGRRCNRQAPKDAGPAHPTKAAQLRSRVVPEPNNGFATHIT